jgi:transposase
MHVGIDVSKNRLDVGVRPSGEAFSAPNDVDGIKEIVARLKALSPRQVVLEASGGFERECAAALVVAGVPTAVVNPRQVRDFAKATGKLAKTDGIDASVLAHFSEAIQPAQVVLDDEVTRELISLVNRRSQLVEMRTMEMNRKSLASSSLKKDLDEHIRWLNTKIKDVDKDISGRIRQSSAWLEKATLLETATGIGGTTSARLLVELPELGCVDRKKIAALVGTAPYNDESGARDGKRRCKGGRASVRTALYMPTLVAIQRDPGTKAFYSRLLAVGKPRKVAIVACMRKLLVRLNAMVRDGAAWCPT